MKKNVAAYSLMQGPKQTDSSLNHVREHGLKGQYDVKLAFFELFIML